MSFSKLLENDFRVFDFYTFDFYTFKNYTFESVSVDAHCQSRKNETKIVKITHSAGTVELAGSHHDPPEDQIDFITPGPSKSI